MTLKAGEKFHTEIFISSERKKCENYYKGDDRNML